MHINIYSFGDKSLFEYLILPTSVEKLDENHLFSLVPVQYFYSMKSNVVNEKTNNCVKM